MIMSTSNTSMNTATMGSHTPTRMSTSRTSRKSTNTRTDSHKMPLQAQSSQIYTFLVAARSIPIWCRAAFFLQCIDGVISVGYAGTLGRQ